MINQRWRRFHHFTAETGQSPSPGWSLHRQSMIRRGRRLSSHGLSLIISAANDRIHLRQTCELPVAKCVGIRRVEESGRLIPQIDEKRMDEWWKIPCYPWRVLRYGCLEESLPLETLPHGDALAVAFDPEASDRCSCSSGGECARSYRLGLCTWIRCSQRTE